MKTTLSLLNESMKVEEIKEATVEILSYEMDDQDNQLTDTERPVSSPWPYISKFFEYVTSENDGNQYVFKCLKCLPEIRLIKAQKRSLFGLRSHVTRRHKDILNDFNKTISLGSRRRYLQHPYSNSSVDISYSDSLNSLSQISTLVETNSKQKTETRPISKTVPEVVELPATPSRQKIEIPSASACENDGASHFGRLIASKLRELPAYQADEVMANILLYFSEVQKPVT